MQAERISFNVVIIGPEATAGSILIFLNNRGNNNPTKLEKVIASNNEPLTHPATIKASLIL